MNFERTATELPVKPLLDLVNGKPYLWSQITTRQSFEGSPHRDTQCIFLRGPEAFTKENLHDDLSAHPYPAWSVLAEALVPLTDAWIEQVGGITELGRVMLVSLKRAGVIRPHADEGHYADYLGFDTA